MGNVMTSQNVPEVATICVQTGLSPARHILEIPCQYVRCHCLNFFGDVCFRGIYGSWFVLVNCPFQISHKKQSGGVRSGERGGQSPFEMTRSLKKD